MNRCRACALVLLASIVSARPARGQWMLTPYAGAAMHTDTGVLDLDAVARRPHATYGVALTRFPEHLFGVEIDSSWMPSPLTGHDLVESSRAVTVTGSVVIAAPRRWLRVMRPYATIGAGLLQISSTDIAGIFPIDSTRAAASAGGGVWMRITRRVGARADVRYLRSRSDGASDRFETWRITAGATIRARD